MKLEIMFHPFLVQNLLSFFGGWRRGGIAKSCRLIHSFIIIFIWMDSRGLLGIYNGFQTDGLSLGLSAFGWIPDGGIERGKKTKKKK